MDTLSEDQQSFDQTVRLRRRHDQLMAENARLRRALSQAQQQIAQLKYLLRRAI